MKTLRTLAVFALIAAIPFSTATAQGRGGGRGGRGGDGGAPAFPTDDAIIKHIWALGMDSSQVWNLAQPFLDSIGPRLHGTPGIKSAHDWIVGTYTKWGISAKNEQYGTWMGWKRGISYAYLTKPRLRVLEASALAMSAPTKGEVTGTVEIFPDVADAAAFQRWLPSVRGKFVAISPVQPTCRPNEEWQATALPETFQRMDEQRTRDQAAFSARLDKAGFPGAGRARNRPLADALTKAGAAGVLVGNWNRGWGVDVISQSFSETIAVVDLSCEDYGLVYRLADRSEGPELKVRVDAEYQPDVPIYNTIATIPGQKPNEYVLLSAHFDSWDAGSGATDNGTGTLTMLEAMRILKQVYPRPKRTIIVGHWSGEEWGLNGSRAWAADHPEVVAGLHAQFNQDNGTGRVVNMNGAGLTTSASYIGNWFAHLPSTFMSQVNLSFPGTPATGGTDNASFDCYGAPGFGLGSLGWDYGTYTHHTNRDTFDKIIFDELKGNATLTAMLAYLASEDPVFMPRQKRVLPSGRGGAGGQPGEWQECVKPLRKWADNNR
ncbi:MAG: M20/M25/M40 family metallo-hydrolase [Gemmatimonadales bacterium]